MDGEGLMVFQWICAGSAFGFGMLGATLFIIGIVAVMDEASTGAVVLKIWQLSGIFLAVAAAFAYAGGL
jgi:hypothetical protein